METLLRLAESAFDMNFKYGIRWSGFFVCTFVRNLQVVSVAVKVFLHLIFFLKICFFSWIFNEIWKSNAQHKKFIHVKFDGLYYTSDYITGEIKGLYLSIYKRIRYMNTYLNVELQNRYILIQSKYR